MGRCSVVGVVAAVALAVSTIWISAVAKPHGHKDHRRFRDAKAWARVFDDPKRDAWQRPEAVVAKLGLKPRMVVADLGAGTGYFVLRFARAVPQGRAYAVDLEKTMVDYATERANRAGLSNVKGVVSAAHDPRLPEPVDMLFLCNTYHHLGARVGYFRKLVSLLKPGARLVVVDFKMGKIPVGPPPGHRVEHGKVRTELEQAGYRFVELDAKTLPYQYIATFEVAQKPKARVSTQAK